MAAVRLDLSRAYRHTVIFALQRITDVRHSYERPVKESGPLCVIVPQLEEVLRLFPSAPIACSPCTG